MSIKFNSLTSTEAFSLSIDLLSLLLKTTPSPLEKETLLYFLQLPPKYQFAPFTTLPKRKYRQHASISPHNLNNRIYSLQKKKFLIKDEDDLLTYHPLLLNVLKTKELMISFHGKINEESNSNPSADVVNT